MIKADSTKCLNRIPESQRENVCDLFALFTNTCDALSFVKSL